MHGDRRSGFIRADATWQLAARGRGELGGAVPQRRYGPPTESRVLAHGTAPVDVGGRSAGMGLSRRRRRTCVRCYVGGAGRAAGHVYLSEVRLFSRGLFSSGDGLDACC
jgi:hypothetical protein